MEKSGTFSPVVGSAVKRTPTLSLSVIMRLLPFVFVSTLPTKPVPDWMPSEVRQKRYPNRHRARFKDGSLFPEKDGYLLGMGEAAKVTS